MKKALVIINPIAGKQRFKTELFSLTSFLCQNGWAPTVLFTERKGHATELTKQHAKDYDRLICCGGDGTLAEVVAGVTELEGAPPVGYIPAGTTNDFANSLSIPMSVQSAAKLAITGTPTKIDIGRFGTSYFTYVASFGAFTSSSYSTPQQNKNLLGHLAYVLEGVKDLSSLHPYHIKVSTSEKTYENDYLLGTVSNSLIVAGLIKMNNSLVKFSDGLFEVMLIKFPTKLEDLHKIILSLQSGEYDPEVIDFFQTDKLCFKSEDIFPWSLDGEYQAGAEKINISVIKKAATVIL